MKQGIRVLALGLMLVGTFAMAEAGRTKGNAIAERLAGKWELDSKLTNQMQPGYDANKVFLNLEIVEDEAYVKSIPALAARLAGKRLYFVGKWTFEVRGQKVTHPMVLTTDTHGNTAIFDFELEKDGRWDSESYIVQLARAVDPSSDLLYAAGDHSREAVHVLRRLE